MYNFNDFDFLHHEQLDEGLYRVFEDWGGPQKIDIYVVIGEDKIAVVDTGCGATHGLRRYIEEKITGKTDKPMIALMSHSHPDHIGGCTLFDAQYIHKSELPQLAWGLNDKRRVHDAAAFAYTGMPGSAVHADLDRAMAIWDYCRENYIPVDWKAIQWNLVDEGDVIDLGDTLLECVFMDAHGSMVYYNREKDYALCGDNTTYTLSINSADTTLADRFEKYLAHFTEKTMFYSGHTYYEDGVTRPAEIDMSMMRELVAAIRTANAGGSFDDEEKSVFHKPPEGAPTLAGYKPDPDDEEAWAAFHATHPENKGKPRPTGVPYVHHVGPIIFSYTKSE